MKFFLKKISFRTREITYRDHFSSDITNTTSPALWRLVEHIVHAETLVLSRKRIQVLLEQDILLRDIGKDQINLSAIARLAASDNRLDDLQHGGNARAAGNHTKVPHHVGRIRESALGPADADGLADGQGSEVLADVTGGVGLDEQVEEAGLLVAADGRVAADDFLVRAIGLVEHGAD